MFFWEKLDQFAYIICFQSIYWPMNPAGFVTSILRIHSHARTVIHVTPVIVILPHDRHPVPDSVNPLAHNIQHNPLWIQISVLLNLSFSLPFLPFLSSSWLLSSPLAPIALRPSLSSPPYPHLLMPPFVWLTHTFANPVPQAAGLYGHPVPQAAGLYGHPVPQAAGLYGHPVPQAAGLYGHPVPQAAGLYGHDLLWRCIRQGVLHPYYPRVFGCMFGCPPQPKRYSLLGSLLPSAWQGSSYHLQWSICQQCFLYF